jgi:hypothetical protein
MPWPVTAFSAERFPDSPPRRWSHFTWKEWTALGASSQFPVNATIAQTDGQRHECLVRFGDPTPLISHAIYRLWFSSQNVNSYINRPGLSNQDVDGTMVVANNRVIYNMNSHYSNSPTIKARTVRP